jgi:C4-dicarboxylate-specific signal transduction histidine kinase
VKLRVILIVLSLLAFLSVTTAGYLYYSSLEETAYIEAEKKVALEALRIQDTLSSYLSENLKSVKALAGLSELSESLENPGESTLDDANSILDHFTEALQVDVCYLMDRQGNTIASSNRLDPDSFVGENFSFRPYFELAIQGSPATYMARGITSRIRGVYYSYPVYGDGEEAPLGVAVIKSPVSLIEEGFKNAFEGTVLLTDPHGITFISNREDWLYRSLWKLSPEEVKRISGTQQFGDGPWDWIGARGTGSA